MLFDKIGEGGMARIYLARAVSELGGEQLVVVKQILPAFAESAEFSRSLIEEAKLAAELSHGNVVRVTDLGREGGTLYIAMEYVEGYDLAELLKRATRARVGLPVEFALFIVIETLRALEYAHKKRDDEGRALGIVHRDVSPSNVLVSFEGEVKLCDFGIARAMSLELPGGELTIQGKAGYMSPEAARGEVLDARADVYAAGILAWELLSGRRLHKARGGQAGLDAALARDVPPLEPRGLPEETRLQAIVMRALEGDRAARFSSALAMQRELEDYVALAGLVASPLRLGEWMSSAFGGALVEERRSRQRAARALELGPPVQLVRVPTAPHRPTPGVSPDEPMPPSLVAVVAPSDPPPASTQAPRWWLAVAAVVVLIAVAVAAALRG